jgi:hypothetical protein
MVHLQAVLPFGIVIGNAKTQRIFSLSTSSQVQDPEGSNRTLGCSVITADKGYQMHLYTREEDQLIVRIPPQNVSLEALQLVDSAISFNQQIWEYFTKVKLCGSNQVVVVSESLDISWLQSDKETMEQFNFHKGTLDQISKDIFLENGGQIVLPIISEDRIQGIQIDPPLDSIAACVSTLNDKNNAIPILKRSGIQVPETYTINDPSEAASALSQLDPKKKYVFKLAGAVASIGMFTNNDQGCTPKEIIEHLASLQRAGKTPNHFQIQEFINGSSYGGIVLIDQSRKLQLLSIHQQIVEEGNWLGLRWEQQIEAKLKDFVLESVKALLTDQEITLLGAFNIDFMVSEDGLKYITEINPRYSAGVPFHTIRTLESNIQKIFPDFMIKTMFLDPNIHFSNQFLQSGMLFQIVQDLYRNFNVVILPQGINPFGNSCVIFINDLDGKGRNKFIEYVTKHADFSST